MKKRSLCLLALVAFAGLTACNEQKDVGQVQPGTVPAATAPAVKNAVVFYSQTGTTRKVATEFAAQLGADLMELKMVKPYPSTYDSTIAAVRVERNSKSWPVLEKARFDLSKYDTIYVGAPIMFGFFAPPMYTFLDSNDLSGKVVVPFCTYGSGGRKASAKELQQLEPGAHVVLSYGIANKRANDSMVNVSAEIRQHIANVRDGLEERSLVGAFGEPRALTEDDMAVFTAATKDYAYLNLSPKSVSTQVVAGTNYIFTCGMKAFGEEKEARVKIFRPLPGRGEPQFIGLDE